MNNNQNGLRPNAKANTFFVLIIILATALISSVVFLTARYFKLINSRNVAAACQDAVNSCISAAGSAVHYFETPAQFIVVAFSILLLGIFIKSLLVPIMVSLKVKNIKPINISKYPEIERTLKSIFKKEALPSVYLLKTLKPVAYTFGLFKTSICVSQGILEKLSSEELEALISHEAAHIYRRDVFFTWLAVLMKDIMFVLPISHWLVSKFIYEKEHAADEFALKITKNPIGLASAIVKVSKMGNSLAPAYTPTFAEKKTVESRVKQLLGLNYRPAYGKKSLIISLIASSIIVMSIVGVAFALPNPNHPSTQAGCGSMSQCQSPASTSCNTKS